jgi:hypothetical protein
MRSSSNNPNAYNGNNYSSNQPLNYNTTPQGQWAQGQQQQQQQQQQMWAHQSSSARVARLRHARLGGAAAEEEARKWQEEAALIQAETEARRAAAVAAEAAHGGWRRLGSSLVEASGECVAGAAGGGCRHRVRMSPEAAAGALAGSAVAAATAVMFEGVPRSTMSGADIFRMLRDQYATSDPHHFDAYAEQVRRRADPTPEERAADERARLEAKAALELQLQLASPSAEERERGAAAAAAAYVQKLRAARGVEPVDVAADPVEATLAAMREMDAHAELRRRELLDNGATTMGMVLAPLQPEERLRYYSDGAANGGAYTRRLIENAVQKATQPAATATAATAAATCVRQTATILSPASFLEDGMEIGDEDESKMLL